MKSTKAFTLIELLVVLTITGVLSAMLLPALASTRANSSKITCLNNLKQIGLAFRTWEASHYSRFPQAVGLASGGANEYVAHGNGTATPTAPTKVKAAGMVFMVMSNELSTPKILFCPSDSYHTAGSGYGTNFGFGEMLSINITAIPGTGLATAEGTTKISYFVNADASEANPQDIMVGDGNIGNNSTTTASSPAAFRFGGSLSTQPTTDQAAGCIATAFNGSPWWSWTANDLHQKSGNLAFADGSCQSVNISGLHYFLSRSTNNFAGEGFNFLP